MNNDSFAGFMTFIGYIIGPAIVFMMIFMVSVVTWLVVGFFQSAHAHFVLAQQLANPAPVTPANAIAREEVLKLRAIQDEARLRRVQRRAAIKRDIANHVVREDADDLMAELIAMRTESEPEPRVMICRNPLSDRREYFVDVLAGRAIGEGAKGLRPAKVYYTPLRNHGRAMPESEARKWLAQLPDAKDLFLVPAEEAHAAPVVKNKVAPVAEALPF